MGSLDDLDRLEAELEQLSKEDIDIDQLLDDTNIMNDTGHSQAVSPSSTGQAIKKQVGSWEDEVDDLLVPRAAPTKRTIFSDPDPTPPLVHPPVAHEQGGQAADPVPEASTQKATGKTVFQASDKLLKDLDEDEPLEQSSANPMSKRRNPRGKRVVKLFPNPKSKGRLGVDLITLPPGSPALPPEHRDVGGVAIEKVFSKYPAAESGEVSAGDMLQAINGVAVTTEEAACELLATKNDDFMENERHFFEIVFNGEADLDELKKQKKRGGRMGIF